MADWILLSRALSQAGDSARYTWDELATMVGGLPASATNHRAWWSGDRPHVNAWRSAGYAVTKLVPGREVTFQRVTSQQSVAAPSAAWVTDRSLPVAGEIKPTVLLVACVKQKVTTPAAARNLYVSPLFRKERLYAERSGLPWFILSAEHGLVGPDEWLAPYEQCLRDTPPCRARARNEARKVAGSARSRLVGVGRALTWRNTKGTPSKR